MHHSRRVGVVTDLGHLPDATIDALRGLDAVVLEANYDAGIVRDKLADPSFAADWHYLSWVASETGHLSNQQCAEALAALLTKDDCHVFLGHLSENHLDPAKDNNSFRKAAARVREVCRRERLPLPHLHRTYRRGLDPGRPSALVEID
jgi:phosphoribosyl 1,2-cyclic phosphodiesterase